jgi:hypothetical protein
MLFTTYYNTRISILSLVLLEPVRMILPHFEGLISLAAGGATLSEAIPHSIYFFSLNTCRDAASFQIINPLRLHFKRSRLRTTF